MTNRRSDIAKEGSIMLRRESVKLACWCEDGELPLILKDGHFISPNPNEDG